MKVSKDEVSVICWVLAIINTGFLALSIISLVKGIHGIKIPVGRVKSIIGVAFAAQNIFMFAYMYFFIVMAGETMIRLNMVNYYHLY